MIHIGGFSYEMDINLEYICKMIQGGTLRKEHYSIRSMRRIMKLIFAEASDEMIDRVDIILNEYPKARRELLK